MIYGMAKYFAKYVGVNGELFSSMVYSTSTKDHTFLVHAGYLQFYYYRAGPTWICFYLSTFTTADNHKINLHTMPTAQTGRVLPRGYSVPLTTLFSNAARHGKACRPVRQIACRISISN